MARICEKIGFKVFKVFTVVLAIQISTPVELQDNTSVRTANAAELT